MKCEDFVIQLQLKLDGEITTLLKEKGEFFYGVISNGLIPD